MRIPLRPLVLSCCAIQCGGLEVYKAGEVDADTETNSTADADSTSDASTTTDASATTDAADDASTSSSSSTGGEAGVLRGACDELWAKHYCSTEEIDVGVQFCGVIDDVMQWGACVRTIACWPGDWRECVPFEQTYNQECVLDEDGLPVWVDDYDSASCWTPLVLRFDEVRLELSVAGARTFDISGTGACLTTDWPGPATPWLVLDRDGDGAIADAREMFGSAVVLRTGERARDGFAALAEHDSDGDGRITPRDAVWPSLLLWSDHDGDRRSTGWELEPVAARGLTAIDLEFRVDPRCDARGNCEVEQAGFTWLRPDGRPAVGTVVDLHLICQ